MRTAFALALMAAAAPGVRAASLDVTASYKMKAVSYHNLDLGQDVNNHSYIGNDARLGMAVKKIALETRGGEDTTLDLGLLLHAVGVSGSTVAVASPINRTASYYPNADLTPFIENAYLKVSRLWGKPIEATFGRQNYRLGSGLLLDDDGAGFTGAVVRAELPWGGMKAEGFLFQDKNPQASAPNSLTLFGFSLDLPTEGNWQLNQLIEQDHAAQLVYGCTYAGDPDAAGCSVSKALRSFTSARYQISYGPMVFDGEAAMEKGVATPTGPLAAPNHITYNGNAQVVRMKWKQSLYRSTSEGVARVSVARGTGDVPGTPTRDEAFYPSHGHRFNGLDRSGFGDFYGATPYDAFGGNYSTSTKSGLPNGASGIIVVGAGYTPPSYAGFALDLDYFLFQAERVATGPRTLGSEWDVRLRYQIRDQFSLTAGLANFKSGLVTDPRHATARKYTFEASGRF
ncbi:MAG: hypothetical protein KGL74_06760 [Elusimicrobia bacterium]|nr:hypothetical protein [Elusimicrobiota bacterium]